MALGGDKDMMAELMQQMQQMMGSQIGSATRQQLKQFEEKMRAEAHAILKDSAKKIAVRESQGLDLLFLLDVTVSMEPYRNGVVNQITTIVSYLEAMYKYSKDKIRVGVVGYRDIQLEPRFEIFPFTPVSAGGEGSNIKEWLNKLAFKTDKANDYPEDVHGGLEKAASEELGWKNAARTIIHIADAPGHGTRLAGPNACWTDRHPDFDADGKELEKLLRQLRIDTKVQTYKFIHIIDPKTEKTYTTGMLEQFRTACGDPAWITEAEWQGDEEMGLEVIEAASESIQASINNRVGAQQQAPLERVYTLDPAEPDWGRVQDQPICISRHDTDMLGSIQRLVQLIDDNSHIRIKEVTDSSVARIRIAPNPFAKGKNRLAYYGRFYSKGLSGGEVQEVVLKEFISSASSDNAAVVYKAQLEAQTVASFLAEHFNKHAAQAAPALRAPAVKYAPCDLVCIPTGRKSVRFLLMEPLILGDMAKFNNNFGYVRLADPQPHLQAFSHWTYEVTDKKLMVVDLQGFYTMGEEDEVEIVLVDPAIHCVNKGFFPSTNLAEAGGFEAFLHSHMSSKFNEHNIHGPICESLLPDCCKYRLQQHDLSKAQSGANYNNSSGPSSGLWQKGGRGRGRGRGRGANDGDNWRKGRGGGWEGRGPHGNDRYARDGGRGGSRGADSGNWRKVTPPSSPPPEQASLSDSAPSTVSTATLAERVEAVKKAMKVHAMCQKLLAKEGVRVPDNLAEAIDLCVTMRLIKSPELAAECHARRKEANKARHEWLVV